jgi:hypothetical protein
MTESSFEFKTLALISSRKERMREKKFLFDGLFFHTII